MDLIGIIMQSGPSEAIFELSESAIDEICLCDLRTSIGVDEVKKIIRFYLKKQDRITKHSIVELTAQHKSKLNECMKIDLGFKIEKRGETYVVFGYNGDGKEWCYPANEREIALWHAINKEEYKDHEFCKSFNCGALLGDCCAIFDGVEHPNCIRTAKDLHKWLKSNGYKIVKGGE